MRILVTGGAGFIGYHLVKRLVQDEENEIIGLDNINTYYGPKPHGWQLPAEQVCIPKNCKTQHLRND